MPYINGKHVMGVGGLTVLPPDMNNYYTKDEGPTHHPQSPVFAP